MESENHSCCGICKYTAVGCYCKREWCCTSADVVCSNESVVYIEQLRLESVKINEQMSYLAEQSRLEASVLEENEKCVAALKPDNYYPYWENNRVL